MFCASEVWGHHKGKAVERVLLDLCSRLLGVKISTNNSMIYAELGRVPLRINKILIKNISGTEMNIDNCIIKNMLPTSV